MINAPQYDEKGLLMQAAAGDRDAFTKLYSSHIDHAFRFIFLFTKSKEETEEILQEVFVKIWEKRENLAGVESFKNYLFRAAKNKLISQVRHIQIRHRVLSEIKRNKSIGIENANYEIDYKAYYQIVQEAIEKLPPKRKLIFRMNIENGLSHDEIAEQLKVSKSFVKGQLYKSYDFVKQYLFKHGEFYFPALFFLTGMIQ
ncbi:MAG TPA: RNA polymerase sigma-70 factor [Chitinophagaceae bacterium]|nr:RNA polymerase sigma-70 factor [Chitinophagaceae bacterium]